MREAEDQLTAQTVDKIDAEIAIMQTLVTTAPAKRKRGRPRKQISVADYAAKTTNARDVILAGTSDEPSNECMHRPLVKPRKIAIVGSASASLHLVPYDDPDYEIWGMAWRCHPQDMKRADRLFEIHRRDTWKSCQGGTDAVLEQYTKMLQTTKTPVYLLQEESDIPAGIKYPMEECKEAIGADYFASSIGYMLALAILEHTRGRIIGEVGVWGVDLLCEDEWAYQRPNAEYMLGILKGMGVKIIVPPQSAMLKMNHAYGREDAPGQGPITVEWLNRRIQEYEEKHKKSLEAHYSFDGATQMANLLAQTPDQVDEKEREFLTSLALTEEQRKLIAKRGEIFLQGRHNHQVALHNLDGALQDARYIKIMVEHHKRHGVIAG